jgi:hypothetical protein
LRYGLLSKRLGSTPAPGVVRRALAANLLREPERYFFTEARFQNASVAMMTSPARTHELEETATFPKCEPFWTWR